VKRSAIVFSTWLGVTCLAVALAWLAVSYAVADVVDPIPAVVTAESHAALASSEVSATSGTAAASETTTAVAPVDDRALVAPTTTVAVASATRAPSPGFVAPAPSDPVLGPATSEEQAQPLVPSPSPTTTAPSSLDATKSFATSGGTVTVHCADDVISLVSAVPQPHYSTQVLKSGPATVDVQFESSTRESRVNAHCVGGKPVAGFNDD
jgi:hypothetical protein